MHLPNRHLVTAAGPLAICSMMLLCAQSFGCGLSVFKVTPGQEDTGCTAGQSGCNPDITVHIQDQDGYPISADTVDWYLDPNAGEFDGEHRLDCHSENCTVWYIQDSPADNFFIVGRLSGPIHEDPACSWSAYDGQPVSFSGTPITVILDLTLLETCR